MASNLILVGNSGSGIYNKDANDLLTIGPKLIAPNSTPIGYFFAPIRLDNASVSVLPHQDAQAEAFVLSGVLGTFNPAQPDTPIGIARTVIKLQDSNKNKNQVDDACP